MFKITKKININCGQNIALMPKKTTIETAKNHSDKMKRTYAINLDFLMLRTLECKILKKVGLNCFNT